MLFNYQLQFDNQQTRFRCISDVIQLILVLKWFIFFPLSIYIDNLFNFSYKTCTLVYTFTRIDILIVWLFLVLISNSLIPQSFCT